MFNLKLIEMKKITLLLGTFILLLWACGPGVDSERKNWKKNKKDLNQFKSTYPAYASLINSKLAEADIVWNNAESISKEEKKAEKMADANRLLTTGCVGSLKNMKSQIRSVETKVKEVIRKQAIAMKGKKFADEKIEDARDAVKSAEKVLASNKSCAKIQSTYKDLQNAVVDLNRAITRMSAKNKTNDKNNSADKSKEVEKNNTEKTGGKTQDKPKKVECDHCGSMNLDTKTKCASCGAPVK